MKPIIFYNSLIKKKDRVSRLGRGLQRQSYPEKHTRFWEQDLGIVGKGKLLSGGEVFKLMRVSEAHQAQQVAQVWKCLLNFSSRERRVKDLIGVRENSSRISKGSLLRVPRSGFSPSFSL